MRSSPALRSLQPGDLEAVVRIDALHTGEEKPDYWQRVFRDLLAPERRSVALAAEADGRVVGYLLGEVRAFEFGSEPCGWVFAVGVEPALVRRRVASLLLAEALRRFHETGLRTIRTMVRTSDVPVLAFFRANGFTGGPFVQLELDLEEET